MVLAVKMFWQFDNLLTGAARYQFVQQIDWVKSLGISYHVGVDGLNVGLILMGAIVAFAAALASWEIRDREKEFYILLLVMTGGILGAFASLDMFFFYFFHELALVPTFIMIGVWGRGRKQELRDVPDHALPEHRRVDFADRIDCAVCQGRARIRLTSWR